MVKEAYCIITLMKVELDYIKIINGMAKSSTEDFVEGFTSYLTNDRNSLLSNPNLHQTVTIGTNVLLGGISFIHLQWIKNPWILIYTLL